MTSPSSNAGESKPLSVDLASTDCMAESRSEVSDTARLDWLQAQKETVYRCTHQDRRATTDTFRPYETVQVFDGWAVFEDQDPKPTIRDAIDWAMQSRSDSPSSDTTSPNEKDGVAPSLPVVHGEGGEDKNHSFNLGSSGDGPESLGKVSTYLPISLDRASVAFGDRAMEILPPYKDIPRDYPGRAVWEKWQSDWFFRGLDRYPVPREGIDRKQAMANLACAQGSFRPKHEHKVAGVAYLASLWFSSPDGEPTKPPKDSPPSGE